MKASIQIQFRPSAVNGKEGCLYFLITHNHTVKHLDTGLTLYPDEWLPASSDILVTALRGTSRLRYLTDARQRLRSDLALLTELSDLYHHQDIICTADTLATAFTSMRPSGHSLYTFMQATIARLRRLNKIGTCESYEASLNSFRRFRNGRDISIENIDADTIAEYEAYLKASGITMNTVSAYMRRLRAVYNRAVEKGITEQKYPFRHVYTGVDRTVKRAVPIQYISRMKKLDLSSRPLLDYARDMFLFSFYTRGMSFVDMAYLKKSDLTNGLLTYCRQKTGQRMFVRWEKNMQAILDKYPTSPTPYLLPIIRNTASDERSQYKSAQHLVNTKLKEIMPLIGLKDNLSMYVARHSWASAARNRHIPLSVISQGMGHDSENTTRIYQSSLSNTIVDKANRLIMNDLK